jgi:DNA-binding PadR family transcriptional regulator
MMQDEAETRPLSTTEYAVLGVLADEPSHGFALARTLGPRGTVGRVFTVRRPLVYRALDRLVAADLAEPLHTEKGDAGPKRMVHRITPEGERRLHRWLDQPVAHIRDLRIEFLLKLALLHRSGGSPLSLIEQQRTKLAPTLAALEGYQGTPDDVALWREHNAVAAASFLDAVEARYRAG